MTTFLFSLLLLGLVMLGMAVGVIMGRKPLKGSCGGVGAALGEKDYVCEICGDDPNKCDEQSGKNLAYDATEKQKENS